VKAEFSGRVQFPQTGRELAPKHPAENAHRQEEPGPRRNPPAAVPGGARPATGPVRWTGISDNAGSDMS
jgi:hypothetical protein